MYEAMAKKHVSMYSGQGASSGGVFMYTAQGKEYRIMNRADRLLHKFRSTVEAVLHPIYSFLFY